MYWEIPKNRNVVCDLHNPWFGLWIMVFNNTFNNISVISWQSVLLVEETGIPGENHWNAASHWQTLSHNVVSSTPHLSWIQTHNVSVERHLMFWILYMKMFMI